MTDQGVNAANYGDVLKHPLICDVLQKCINAGWKNITYAETHAGAGIYSSLKQGKIPSNDIYNDLNVKELRGKKYHIKALFKAYYESKNNATSKDTYREILNKSWEQAEIDADTEIKYAGSAYLAASILKATNARFDIRLTENDPLKCNQLKDSLTGLLPTAVVSNHIEQASFQGKNTHGKDMIDWLTENDNLILIIDPFKLSLNFNGIKKGGIDLYHLLKLTESVKGKKKAVVGFWYSTDQKSNQLGLPCIFTKTIIQNYGKDKCRRYYFGIYNFILIGFGGGIEIVNNLPSQSELQNRWFVVDIKEDFFTEKMKEWLVAIRDLESPTDSKEKHLGNSHIENLKNIIRQIDNLEAETGNES